MDCDWVFLNKDRSRIQDTISEPTPPQIGSAKHRNNRLYYVGHIIEGTTPNPTIIAIEV